MYIHHCECVCILPEELLHEAVKALNPAVLGWLDRLGPVRDKGQHRCILSNAKEHD